MSRHMRCSKKLLRRPVTGAFSGMLRPSAFAVLRLITSSNLVDCNTGRSEGFAPLRNLRGVDPGTGNKHPTYATSESSCTDRSPYRSGRSALDLYPMQLGEAVAPNAIQLACRRYSRHLLPQPPPSVRIAPTRRKQRHSAA